LRLSAVPVLVLGPDIYSQAAMLYYLSRNEARHLLKKAHTSTPDIQNCLLILEHVIPSISEELYPSVISEDREYRGRPQLTCEQVWQLNEQARVPK
jgi:hypothetical protein